eukprot:jgi/Mesvir1/1415/Mv14414-RA.1
MQSQGSSIAQESPAVARGRRLLGRKVRIGIIDGRRITGYFRCMDKQGNIILRDAVETRPCTAGDAYERTPSDDLDERHLGLVLIPASRRASCEVYGPLEAGSDSED